MANTPHRYIRIKGHAEFRVKSKENKIIKVLMQDAGEELVSKEFPALVIATFRGETDYGEVRMSVDVSPNSGYEPSGLRLDDCPDELELSAFPTVLAHDRAYYEEE
ncbi:hypothetical protein [Zymobacter sp. IVIA_12111.31 C1]|uniref:hypothetical protein n=1 Tax=Zymobacter sp. IVIA_12111.31 C1 TaxID=3394854 RepID=UPI0039C01030